MNNKKASLADLITVIAGLTPAHQSAQVDPGSDLFSNGILDSLTIIQLIVALEKEFGIVFNYGHIHIDYFRSPTSLLGLLQKEYGL
jgi:acyl carrier protein